MLSEMKSIFGEKKINIILAGEGGQGIQTIAKILSKSAINCGLEASYMPSFGVEQRGAPSVAYITIDSKLLRYPKFDSADIAVILQKRAILPIKEYITLDTKIIFDSSTTSVQDLPKRASHLLGLPATKDCYEKFKPKSLNVLVLGALSKLIRLDEKIVWKEVLNVLGRKFKTSEIKELNYDAFIFGREIVFEKEQFSDPVFQPKHTEMILMSSDREGKIVPKRCKGCGICIVKCPVGALSFGDDIGYLGNPVPKVDLEKCIACGNCSYFCPDGAIYINRVKKEPNASSD